MRLRTLSLVAIALLLVGANAQVNTDINADIDVVPVTTEAISPLEPETDTPLEPKPEESLPGPGYHMHYGDDDDTAWGHEHEQGHEEHSHDGHEEHGHGHGPGEHTYSPEEDMVSEDMPSHSSEDTYSPDDGISLPVPSPHGVPVPAPMSEPAPVPAPMPVPIPVPAPMYVPGPVPGPDMVPGPVPVPVPGPAGAMPRLLDLLSRDAHSASSRSSLLSKRAGAWHKASQPQRQLVAYGCSRGLDELDRTEPVIFNSAVHTAGVRCCGLQAGAQATCTSECVSWQEKVTLQEAETRCDAAGARLCTHDQLVSSDACCAATCGYDNDFVWTGDRAAAEVAELS